MLKSTKKQNVPSEYKAEFEVLANRKEIDTPETQKAATTIFNALMSMKALKSEHKTDSLYDWVLEGDYDGTETIHSLVKELNQL